MMMIDEQDSKWTRQANADYLHVLYIQRERLMSGRAANVSNASRATMAVRC